MALFAKVDTGIHRNPKVRQAGPDAREVFIFLLCVNREHLFDGNIPPSYSSADYIARELQRRPKKIKAALEACIRSGLLKAVAYPSDDGAARTETVVGVRLAGWDETWRTFADDSRDRVKRFREKAAESKGAVTVGNGVTGHRVEQSRAEEEETSPVRQPGFDLLAVYRAYPRHEGKTKGLARLKAQIKTQADYDALVLAAERYRNSQKVREGFVKHFDTFANCWRDYLEEPRDAAKGDALSDFDRRILAIDAERRKGNST